MKISELTLDERNANKGTARGLKALDHSLRQYGAGRSILIDKNGRVIAGNKTVERAAGIGLEEVEVVQSDGKKLVAVQRTDLDLETDSAARELAYADNRVGQLDLDWNIDTLLADIEAGVDLGELFSGDDLAKILEAAGTELLNQALQDAPPQIDRAEELQAVWQVKPGDVWRMDDHYLICGDCREADTWKRLLVVAGVDKVNGVFTSPPYAEQRKAQYGGVPTAEYVEWWEAVQANVRSNLAGDGSFFVNIKPHCEDGQRVLYVFDLVLAMVRGWGWKFVDELCWTRNPFPGGYDNRFKNGFEPIYHFSANGNIKFNKVSVADRREPNTHIFGESGSKSGFVSSVMDTGTGVLPSNVLNVETGEVNIGTQSQPATFPIRLPAFFVKAYSDPGDVWLDPFLGSGTTIVAAHNEKRRGLGIERLEKYCAVTLQRWADLTGRQPALHK